MLAMTQVVLFGNVLIVEQNLSVRWHAQLRQQPYHRSGSGGNHHLLLVNIVQ